MRGKGLLIINGRRRRAAGDLGGLRTGGRAKFGREVGRRNGAKFTGIVPIVFEDGHDFLLFCIEEIRCRGEPVGSAKFTLEGGFNHLLRLTRMGLYDEIGVSRFPVDGGRYAAIVQAAKVDIQEGEGAVLLNLMGKFHARVNFIQKFLESNDGILKGVPRGAAEARAAGGEAKLDGAKAIVHINHEILGLLHPPLFSEGQGARHGKTHPELRKGYHDG